MVRWLLGFYKICKMAFVLIHRAFNKYIVGKKIICYSKFLQDTVLDEFVIAHVLGWWGKAIMIRNGVVLWILSIGFEMMEVIISF